MFPKEKKACLIFFSYSSWYEVVKQCYVFEEKYSMFFIGREAWLSKRRCSQPSMPISLGILASITVRASNTATRAKSSKHLKKGLKRCSYDQKTETKMDRKEIHAKVNSFNTQVFWWPIMVHRVMTNTKEGITQFNRAEIVLDAYSSRVRCSFHCSFQKNFLQLHLLLSLVCKKTSHTP